MKITKGRTCPKNCWCDCHDKKPSSITDKMRLDWFENDPWRSVGCEIKNRYQVTQEDPEALGNVRIDTGTTIRRAIDSAIRASRPKKRAGRGQ